ncbi:MAG: hypothetical protein LRY25_00270 [Flavobacterium sp.]|nr:hypothetical protein [Flavobacterium sp.]
MKEYLGNQLQYCGNKALQCTCQLFFKTKAKGSGILLSVKGEDFLVSAAHVLEPEIIESMTIPNGEILVQIQGEMRVTKFQLNETREDDKIDIAIVKLTKACSNDLKKRFIFLDEIQIDFNHLELDSHQYFFCGFPVVDTNVDIQQIKIFPVPMKVRTKITKKKLFEATDYYKGSKWILDYDRLKQLSVVNYEKKNSFTSKRN